MRPRVEDLSAVDDARSLHLLVVCGLALVVGVITGLGAVVFRALIGFVHNLLFLGHRSRSSTTPACSRRHRRGAPWVILVPVIGGIGVTFIVSTFAPEAKGHGVPEVMDAIYYKRGVIRPVVAVAKSLASALSIGSGAAVGREGPIIQIGSALGSTLGQVIRMSMGQRIILVAAGAGCRHRRDLQHADRRRAVRDRTDAAGNQRQHVPAGGNRDRHRDLHRPAVLRRQTGVRHSGEFGVVAGDAGRRADPAAVRGAGRGDRCRGRTVRAQPALGSRICSTKYPAATCATCSACCWSAC